MNTYHKAICNSFQYLAITGVAIFMFRGIFAPGFMSGYDNSFHYYDVHYLTKVLIPRYHWISGWSMQGMAGMPIFVDYYQMGFLMIAFLNKMLSLPLNFSYKLMVLISYISTGAGFYKISSYRFGRIAAFMIAVCLILQKDIYYDKILAGVWNNYLAIGLFFIFFHMLAKYIERMSLERTAKLGLLLGLVIITHLYVAIFAFLIVFIYIFFLIVARKGNRLFVKELSLYFLIPLIAILVSSYYLYGFIVSSGYFAKMSSKDILTGMSWSLKSLFGPFENAPNIISAFFINLPIVARILFSLFGIYVFLKKERDMTLRRFLTAVIFFTSISLLLFSDILPNIFDWWKTIPFVGNLQTNRFLIYIQMGMYIFAAYGLSIFLNRLKKKLVPSACLVILLAFSIFFHYIYIAREGTRTLNKSPQMEHIHKVWNWVAKNIDPADGRIVYQDTIGNSDDPILKRSDVFALSGVFTKLAQIGVSRPASPFPQEIYMRNDHGNVLGGKVYEMSGHSIKSMMENFNSGYIVTVEPNLKNKLDGSELFFKEEEFGPFTIFRLKEFVPAWIGFAKDASYKTVLFDDQHLIFHIWNKAAGNEAVIKVAHHPFWRAWLNGKPARISQARYSLMEMGLPRAGRYSLELSFNSFNPFWTAVSSISFIMSLIIWISGRRKALNYGQSI